MRDDRGSDQEPGTRWRELLDAYRAFAGRPARRSAEQGARRVLTAIAAARGQRPEGAPRRAAWRWPALAAAAGLALLASAWLLLGTPKLAPRTEALANGPATSAPPASATRPAADESRLLIHTLSSGTRLFVVLPEPLTHDS